MKKIFLPALVVLVAATQFSFAADKGADKDPDPCKGKNKIMCMAKSGCTYDVSEPKFLCFTNCETVGSERACTQLAHCRWKDTGMQGCKTSYSPTK